MSKLDSVPGLEDFKAKDVGKLIELLAEQVRERHPDPVDVEKSRDTYYSLRPEVRDWLMNANEKKLEKLDQMLDDYGAAQQIGRFIKIFFFAMVGVITTTWGAVKAAPDFIEWLRGILAK